LRRCWISAARRVTSKKVSGAIVLRVVPRETPMILGDLVTWTQSHGQDIQFRLESLNVVELLKTTAEGLCTTLVSKNQTIRIDTRDHGLIQGHGGRLYWESVAGSGSDFCFPVPELLG
jgi:hypothetical protein